MRRTTAGSQRGWWWLAAAGLLAAVLAWTLWPRTGVDASMLHLASAEFRAGPQEAWQPVALPDTWSLQGRPASGDGEYRVRFVLPQAPTEPWALYANRLSTVRTVAVNGALVEQAGDRGRIWPVPSVVRLPVLDLRGGMNELHIAVHYRYRGGLSDLHIGPAPQVEDLRARALWWEHDLPQNLNLAAGLFSLLLLLVRWRQPREQAVGLFALAGLVGSARNYLYVGPVLMDSAAADRVAFGLTSCMVLLIVAYARCVRTGTPPALRGPWGGAVAGVLLLAVALPIEWLPPVRRIVYAGLFVAGLGAARDGAIAARQATPMLRLLLVALLVLVLLAGLHDYGNQIAGWFPITHQFALLWALPLALCAFATVLIVRLFDAMAQVELLNRTLEERVRQRTAALDAANEAKSRFLATASHDLRQPLVSISLLWNLLRDGARGSDARTDDLLGQMGRALHSMEALLRGLLDFSRLESQDRAADLRPVDLAALCESVLAAAQPQAAFRGLRLRARLPHGPLVVQSDAVLLEQMLRNLVDNALRYTERGGVLLAARRRGGRIELGVHDTGRGIAEADRERIFEPFLQLDNPARSSRQGWGLGLAIVRRGAMLLGHEVQLRSVAGRGSTFRLLLAPAQRSVPQAPASAPVPLALDLLAGRLVWLVEDEDGVREALALQFVHWGARVRSFASAAALRDWLDDAQDWPDLLVCDARLPDGHGLDLVALVRHDAPVAVAALLVTGDTGPDQLARQQRAGVRVLHKPFGADALRKAAAAALDSVQADAAPGHLDHGLRA